MRVIRLLVLSFVSLLAVLGLLALCDQPAATLASSVGPAVMATPTGAFTSPASIPLLARQFPNTAVRTYAKISGIHAVAAQGDSVWAATECGC
jgi:hypothetical protein